MLLFQIPKMNFTLFLPILTLLNFSIDFDINKNQKQAFLFFSSENCSAYLHRENNEVTFKTEFGNHSSLYRTTITDKLRFSWKGFTVNGTEMLRINSTMNFTDRCCIDFEFTDFTILSSIPDFSYILDPSECTLIEIQPVFSSIKQINYGYIVAIVFCVGLLLNIKPQTVREHFSKFSNVYAKETEL